MDNNQSKPKKQALSLSSLLQLRLFDAVVPVPCVEQVGGLQYSKPLRRFGLVVNPDSRFTTSECTFLPDYSEVPVYANLA